MSWFNPHRDFVVIPSALNAVVGVLAIFAAQAFEENWLAGLFVASTSFLISVWTFRAYFDDRVGNRTAWIAIVINLIILVMVFASVHYGVGIIYAGADKSTGANNIDFWSAIYFSIVTFTTLGYGDFQPSQDLRLIAGMQAIFGYVYLGFFVASAHHYATQP